MHELMHGLGPHNIKVDGQATTVRLQLKELYSAIEEAKADVTGSVGVAVFDRQRRDRQTDAAHALHDFPGEHVSFGAIWSY